MKPTPKSDAMEAHLSNLAGKPRAATIQGNSCIVCDGPAVEFKNDTSRREYAISGLCQVCQDDLFEAGEDDPDCEFGDGWGAWV